MSGGGGSSSADLTALLDSIAGFTTIFEDLFSLEVTAANSAVVQAENASTSAAAAATSAASVSTLAADAADSANQAVTQAGNAVTEAISAQNNAAAAAASATAAAASASAAQAAATAAQSVQASLGTLYELTATGGTVTLTATQAGASIIWATGNLTSNLTVVVPATVHPFIMDNATTGTGTLTVQMTGGSASATVGQGNANQLFCDGSTGIYSVSSVSGLQFTGVKPISAATNTLTNQYQGAYTPMTNGGSTTFQVTLPTGATMGVGGAVFLDALSGKWSVAPASGNTADFGSAFAMNASDKAMFTWNGTSWRTTLYSNQNSPVFSQSLTVPVAYITGRAVLGGAADDGTTALQATTGRFTTSLTVPTMAVGDNSFNAANTAFVYAAIQALIGGAPGNLDTLNELAAAINDNTSFATTITNLIATKAAISGQTFTGQILAPSIVATGGYVSAYGWNNNTNNGMLYLSQNGANYLLWDGTNYNLPNGQLYIDSYEAWHTGNFTPGNYALLSATATFGGQVTGTASTYALRASNGSGTGQTTIGLFRAGAATDLKNWEIIAGADNSFGIRSINDAYSSAAYAIQVTRPSGYTLGAMVLMGNEGRVLVGNATDDTVTQMQVNSSLKVQRLGTVGQSILLAPDLANTNSNSTDTDNNIVSYSTTSNAKWLTFNATTDTLDTPLTAGTLGISFQIYSQTQAGFGSTGNLILNTSMTDDGLNKLQVYGGVRIFGTGKGITFPDGTQQTTAYAVTNPVINTYTPAAGTTVIATQTYGLGLVQVFEGGAYLVPGQDYTATTGNSITLTTAANGRNSYTVMTGALFNASNVIQPNVVVVPATVGSTSLTLPSSTMAGYLWIFQGGAWLQPNVDFTFNGGTAVTLLNAPTESTDSFTLVMLQPVSFANTATQTNVQNAQLTFALDTGVANAYAVTYIPAVGAPVNGMQLSFYVKTANTGASTLACNGGTAYPIYGNGHAALSGGELIAGGFVEVFFNSVLGAWILLENTGGAQQNAGNLNFIGEGARITGDMSNSTGPTWKNNLSFQSSVVNGSTAVNAVANGTGNNAQFSAFAASDPTNAAYATLAASTSAAGIYSGAFGTGVATPFVFSIAGSERMRIGTNGTLMIASTSNYSAGGYGSSSYYQIATTANSVRQIIQGHANNQGYGTLYVNGAEGGTSASALIFLNSSNTLVGSVTCTTTATAFNTTSDYRLKKNVVKMKGALDRLMKLRPSTYLFKHDEEAGVHEGFLAHELQEVVPSAVTGEKDAVRYDPVLKDGYDPKDVQPSDVVGVEEHLLIQAVDYSKLVPLLTAALQEANQRIEALEKDRDHMRKQIDSLIVHVEGLKRSK
jgi:hypothetical protein